MDANAPTWAPKVSRNPTVRLPLDPSLSNAATFQISFSGDAQTLPSRTFSCADEFLVTISVSSRIVFATAVLERDFTTKSFSCNFASFTVLFSYT